MLCTVVHDLLNTLDSRFCVPGRQLVMREVEQVLIELKAKISSFSEEADVWSKKGLTSSYLGITAHFFPGDTIAGTAAHLLYVGWSLRIQDSKSKLIRDCPTSNVFDDQTYDGGA